MVVQEGAGKPREMRSERQMSLRHRYLVLRKLGQGTYGKVQLAINKETNEEVAVKTIKKTKIANTEDMVRIRREIKIMSTIRHPNIIHIYEVFETKERIVLVMQYASGGELYDYLGCHKMLPEDEARRIFRQIAAAIYYCHKNQICHRDLKLENILLDEEGNTKIADFGLSNIFDGQRKMNTFCGSPLYASPEIVKGTPYNGPEVDCWSLGVLLFALVYGTMPFDGKNFKELVSQISSGNFNEPENKSSASGLIHKLLATDASKRADIYDVCNDEWINHGHPIPLLYQADSMFRNGGVEYSELTEIEKRRLDSKHNNYNAMTRRASGTNTGQSVAAVEPKNLVPHIPYTQINSSHLTSGENTDSNDIALVVNDILERVAKIVHASDVDNSHSLAKQEAISVEKLLQRNGVVKSGQLAMRNDVVDTTLRYHLVNNNINTESSGASDNSSGDILPFENGQDHTKRRSSCFAGTSKTELSNHFKRALRNKMTNGIFEDDLHSNFTTNKYLMRDENDMFLNRKMSQKVSEKSQRTMDTHKPSFFEDSSRPCDIGRCGRKSTNLLFLQASRRRANSLCKTLAFTFECGVLSKAASSVKKPPGKVTIPKSFDPSESEVTQITEKERLLIFPCVSVSENKEIIQKKIEKVKRSALNIIPRRNSDVTRRSRKKKYIRSHTEGLPGIMCSDNYNECILESDFNENCTSFYTLTQEQILENAQLLYHHASDRGENEESDNFSFRKRSLDEATFLKSINESYYRDRNNVSGLKRSQSLKENSDYFSDENKLGQSVEGSCDFDSISSNVSGKETMPVSDEKIGDIRENDTFSEKLRKMLVLNDPSRRCSHRKLHNRNTKIKSSSLKHPFRKYKSEECRCASEQHLLCNSTKYATSDQLFQDSDHLNSYFSESSLSTKSCCSCAINDELLKEETNIKCVHKSIKENSKYGSKSTLNDPCLCCEKCALLQGLQKSPFSSSAPNLVYAPKIAREVEQQEQASLKLSKSLEALPKIERLSKTCSKTYSSCKVLASDKDRKSKFRNMHESLPLDRLSESPDPYRSLSTTTSKRVQSELDVRCHKPNCSRNVSYDHCRNLAERLAYESMFLEFSEKELNQNNKKKTSTLPRSKMGRSTSPPSPRKPDQTMKLKSLKSIQEAEYELNRTATVRQEEETNSGSLLEALKMHGYRSVMSSRFQQNVKPEDDMDDTMYYSDVPMESGLPNNHLWSTIDYRAALQCCPNDYSFHSMPRIKKSKKLSLNYGTMPRKHKQYPWDQQVVDPVYSDDIVCDTDTMSYMPSQYTPIDYPVFTSPNNQNSPMHGMEYGRYDVNRRGFANDVNWNSDSDTNGYKQRGFNNNYHWDSDSDTSGYKQRGLNSNYHWDSDNDTYGYRQRGINSNFQWDTEDVSDIAPSAEPRRFSNGSTNDESDSPVFKPTKRMALKQKDRHKKFDAEPPNATADDPELEESVSHRIWRKSFYSRFNNRPLSKRTKAFSLESDVFNDNRSFKFPERAFRSLDSDDYEHKSSRERNSRRGSRKSLQSSDETVIEFSDRLRNLRMTSEESVKCDKSENVE